MNAEARHLNFEIKHLREMPCHSMVTSRLWKVLIQSQRDVHMSPLQELKYFVFYALPVP